MQTGFTHESAHNESKEWYTPPAIFERLGLQFDVDPASPGALVVPWIPAKVHHTVKEDGLHVPWCGKVWLNPPYGQDTPRWLAKLVGHGNGIALVFARTDTEWFHQYAVRADVLCFMRGRIRFISGSGKVGTSCAGAGSLLLAYGEECAKALLSSGLGWMVDLRRR